MKKTIHQKIAMEIVEEKKKNPEIIAIALFGSVANGKERPDSDIDIEIVSSKAKTWKLLKRKRKGIQIDLQVTPKAKLIDNFKKYPYLCYDYLNERIVYDPEGFLKKFKKRVRDYIKKNPKVEKFWKNKLKIMKHNKAKGQDPEEAIKSYDEAEILFSKEHKVTRDFFRK